MILANVKPPVVFQEDDMLKLPSPEKSEILFLEVVSYLQQWGVLVCIIGVLLCFIVSKLFKIKKNPKLQRVWIFYAWGCIFLTIVCAVLPYIILGFY